MYSPFDLGGKVMLVTGGNGGIGLGMAEALVRAGATVCIWGTNAEKNADALRKLTVHRADTIAMQCDVADEAAVNSRIDELVGRLGRLDACFANAGLIGDTRVKSFVEMEYDEWRRVMRVNLDGAFHTLRAAARHMIAAQRGGSLVATSSIAALSGPPRMEHYAASKGAVISMTQALAVELARFHIRANAILPGWIESSMTADAFAYDKFVEKVLPRVPLRRWGTPEDFGGIAVYLASDASAYHTGDSIVIDGGYTKY
ncbi:MAG TPA: SDR family NAD(P)-dependent oxidoreductase [Burkholderiales bacterium]|nr:SDR family NAD(P)-dependent oxidoreductase [Burkholderiales bacterium]